MPDLLNTAIELHQAGELSSAAQLYEKALAREPEDADTLHLIGVLHHQQGKHARAVEEITKAVALRPNVPLFHANMAEAYRALGEFERAAGCCRTALLLWSEYPEAHCNLGLALLELGKNEEAADHFRQAVRLKPEMAVAQSNLGMTLRRLGRLDEALEHFRRGVELDPTSYLAHTNLGQILVDTGHAEEALPYCQEAVRLQPNLAVLHHNLATSLRALGQFTDARAAYLEAIRLDPNLARSHAHLGMLLHEQGQLDDALPWLKRAAELEPANADFWESLAELHREREEFSQAIPCWERVLVLTPKRVLAHNALGWALQEEGRLSEALEHYQTALRLQPDFAAAKLSVGGVHEELGEFTQAEAAFREALRLQPAFALPHARLAILLRGKLPDADRAALEERLADPQLGEEPRTHLMFGLAQVLDARGDYARAADFLRTANILSLERAGRRNREYSQALHEQFVDRLLEVFDPDFFKRMAGAGLKTRRPVFVFGLPRSGTTLVEQILASHSQVHGAGEVRLCRQSFEAIPAALDRSEPPLDCIAHLDAAAIHLLAEQHNSRLQALAGNDAARVVDKMPDNYIYVGMLAVLFPQAVFIHCRRDLRDVAVSCWMTDFRSIRWANDPEHIASRFRQYCRLMDHWRAVLPVPIHEVDYQETVTDLESVARRLVRACGLDWDPACLEFHRMRRPIRTASVVQVRQPIYQKSVARWKNYERELAGLFALLPEE